MIYKIKFRGFDNVVDAADFATLVQESLVNITHDGKYFVVFFKEPRK